LPRRSRGLYGVVLEQGAAGEAQERHGEHRGRDRRGHRQAREETEVGVRAREHRAEHHPEEDRLKRQLPRLDVSGDRWCGFRSLRGLHRREPTSTQKKATRPADTPTACAWKLPLLLWVGSPVITKELLELPAR